MHTSILHVKCMYIYLHLNVTHFYYIMFSDFLSENPSFPNKSYHPIYMNKTQKANNK